MGKKSWLAALFVFMAATVSADVGNAPVKSRVSHVTLYRSQALVVRDVSVPNESGELALLVENLPSSIVPGSLFASSKDLKIRSVRYLTELIPDKPSDDKIAQLENKINDLNVAKSVVAAKQALQQAKKAYLDRVEAQYISKLGPSATTVSDKETKVSGFDFDSIAKMTDFVFKQQDAVAKQNLDLAEETRKIDESIKEAQRQIEALRHGAADSQKQQTRPDPNVARKAVVYVAKAGTGKADLSLSYIVGNAGWNPAYNMRMTSDGNKLSLEYLAHVRQLTGEDWNGVTLTLSTATPNMNAEIPLLAPMWVRLAAAAAEKKNSSSRMADADVRALEESSVRNAPIVSSKPVNPMAANAKMQMGSLARYRQEAGKGSVDNDVELNAGAWNQQSLEFSNTKEILRKWSEDVRKIEQQMAVEYKIPDTVTFASRDDNQMAQILSETLDCSMYYEAVPLLAAYVSRGVEAKNTINQPLLAGEYSAFIDGQYVGSGPIPVTATGQTLTLGFGIDPQLRCRRELVDKTGDRSWGSRVESYKYCLILDNYKAGKVSVRLLDRIPVTKDKGLKITLKDGKSSLSKDADYVESGLPDGILRWDVSVPGGSSGAKAFKQDYSFDMKFDANMQISDMESGLRARLREDLLELKTKKQRK